MIETSQTITATVKEELFTLNDLKGVHRSAFWLGVTCTVVAGVGAAMLIASAHEERQRMLETVATPDTAAQRLYLADQAVREAIAWRDRERDRVRQAESAGASIGEKVMGGIGEYLARERAKRT